MIYIVYFLFVVWLLSGLGGLLTGALISFGPSQAAALSNKPGWLHFASGIYTLTMGGIIYWLYSNGTLTESWVLFAGVIVALPEVLLMFLWKKR